MENASKALIIAGAILLAIILISLGMMVFTVGGDFIKNNIDMSEQEIVAFNNKFTPYQGDTIRGSQVNALIQAVLSSNQSALDRGEEKTKGITVTGPDINISPTTGASGEIKRVLSGTIYTVKFEYKNSLVNKITITAKNTN